MQWHLLGLPLVCVPVAGAARTGRCVPDHQLYAALIYGFWLSRLWIVGAIACVGRMALSNYILQTRFSALFYHRPVYLKFVASYAAGVYSGLDSARVSFSGCVFPSGPLEWAWRR